MADRYRIKSYRKDGIERHQVQFRWCCIWWNMVDSRRTQLYIDGNRSNPHTTYKEALECVEYHRREDVVDIKEV